MPIPLSKNTRLLSVASFLTDFSSEMIIPLIPFFLTQILFAPVFIVGLIEGLREFIARTAGIFAGIYADKTGKRKPVILAGYSISTLAKGGLLLVAHWTHVLGVVLVDRIGKGVRGAPRDALLRQSEPSENLGKAIGFRKMMDNLGAIAGPLVVGILFVTAFTGIQEESYRSIFTLALFPALLAVLLLFFVQEKKTVPQSTRAVLSAVSHAPNFRRFLFATALFALGIFAIPLFLLRSGDYLPLYLIPLAYLAYNVFFTIFSLPAGYLTDRWGGKRALLIAEFLFFLSVLGFAYFAQPLTIFLFMAGLGLFMAFYETAPRVFLAKSVPEKNYASAIGIYRGVLGGMALLANVIAGALWGSTLFEIAAPFAFSIGTSLLGMGLLFSIVKE